jgi:3-phenylpropionate/trans-cinnamate dioxygenase ferredoxin component
MEWPLTGHTDEFEAVARVEEVPEGGLLGVTRADGERICLARRAGDVYAIRDECTHQAFPLSAGSLVAGGGCRIECIWHGAQFDLMSGGVLKGPAEEPLIRYAVKVEGGKVLIGKRL